MKKPEKKSLKLEFKKFLEKIQNESDFTKEEFLKKKIVFEVKNLKSFLKIKDLNLNFTLLDRDEEELKDNTYSTILDLIDPNIVYIDTELNEFYAKTNVTQYYVNKTKNTIELVVKFPQNPKIQFSKFDLELNGKKVTSKILEKEKAKEKYNDAIASGNVGIISSIEDKFIKVNIGNIAPFGVVKLTTEFIQFITSEDMSYCFETMRNYPVINDRYFDLKDVKAKIILKCHSRITRLITFGLNNENIIEQFNKIYNECEISFAINEIKKKNKNKNFKILFRTEAMNDLNLISQYDPIKKETSCILSMLYCKEDIKIPSSEYPDINKRLNYIETYQKNIINNDPSLFIFIIDQSGSMSGQPIELVKETLIFFMQSLPKNSYFQLIGFGSNVEFINENPVEYTEDNVKKTIKKIKALYANLGGTELILPLREIYKEENYNNINLGRNIFILTDGETMQEKECLNIISENSHKYRVHSFGIGSEYDKKFIEECGIRGKGSYNFVNDISKIKEAVIQSLNNSLRSYMFDVKFNLKDQKFEYDFTPINSMCYQDEILNYYFIIKGKIDKDQIKVGLQYYLKKKLIEKEFIFKKNKMIKDEDGDIISKIIIGNILNNTNQSNAIEKEKNIELSLKYKVLSEYTSLFAKIENENANIDQQGLKLIEQNYIEEYDKKEPNERKIINEDGESEDVEELEGQEPTEYDEKPGKKKPKMKKYAQKKGDIIKLEEESPSESEPLEEEPSRKKKPKAKKPQNMITKDSKRVKVVYDKKVPNKRKIINEDSETEDVEELEDQKPTEYDEKTGKKKSKKTKYVQKKGDIIKLEEESPSESEPIEEEPSRKKKPKKKIYINKDEESEESEESQIFDFKKMVLTQNIINGNWTLNAQTKFLIEEEKIIFNKIEKIINQKNLGKNEQDIIITILVLHSLLKNKDINRLEYAIIINKGLEYLKSFGIDYNEIKKKL